MVVVVVVVAAGVVAAASSGSGSGGCLLVVVVVVVVRLQGRAAQQSAAQAGHGRTQREGSRCFMCDTSTGRGGVTTNLPAGARAAGLIVALSTPLGCAEYMERSCDCVGRGRPPSLRNDVS